MILGHASDIHGRLGIISGCPDAWLLTGDFLPNAGYGLGEEVEIAFQNDWFLKNSEEIRIRLAGKPVLYVNGNHDFADLGQLLFDAGIEVHAVTPEGVEFNGLRFSGFREVPFIVGDWVGETHDFRDLTYRTFSSDPDILVTHAAPSGILDNPRVQSHTGIREITNALTWQRHKIQAHFFGHVHNCGGQSVEEMGIRFFNGATTCRIIEI